MTISQFMAKLSQDSRVELNSIYLGQLIVEMALQAAVDAFDRDKINGHFCHLAKDIMAAIIRHSKRGPVYN